MPATAPARDLEPTDVVEPLLKHAIERGDAIAYVVRTVIGSLALLRTALSHPERLSRGDPKTWIICVSLLLGIVLPPLARVWTRRAFAVRTRAMLSVGTDALMATLALFPMVVWPSVDYRGFLREIEIAFFCLTIAATGLRLSRRVVVVGLFANMLGVATLLAADHVLQPARLQYGVSEMLQVAILLVGAFMLALLLANRTRTLVFEGSRATLMAERARQRLGIYVSEEVATQALRSGPLELGGARREVAVLFSDLRDFTSYSEGLPPEGLVRELNEYFLAMVDVIRREGGIIDKYIGDAIMAVFGLHGPQGDAAVHALRAAAGMQAALELHNRARAAKGRPPLRHGIGVHFGPVVAGNIGTPERMQYTVVGEVVNLASRLESATKELQVPIVASAQAVEAARRGGADGMPRTESRGAVAIRGSEKPVEVYAVLV